MTNFVPMPGRRKRGVLRWLLLAFNTLPFALIILLYPALESFFANSFLRLVLLTWACLIVLHMIVVAAIDLRESLAFSQRERERRRMIRTQKNRQRMMNQLYATPVEDEKS